MRPLAAFVCAAVLSSPAAFAQDSPALSADVLAGLSAPIPGAATAFYAEAEALFFWFKPVCVVVVRPVSGSVVVMRVPLPFP